MTSEEARQVLIRGNLRFATGVVSRALPRDFREARAAVAEEQHPIAVIVGCSDSRVGPDTIFDQGVGGLFEVRTAGQVVDAFAQGSVEYAVEHLHCSLVVVLGHERCGAVTAAVNGSHEQGEIAAIVAAIEPAVDEARTWTGDDLIANSVQANAMQVARALREAPPILRRAVRAGALEIVAAYYDLDTGIVRWL